MPAGCSWQGFPELTWGCHWAFCFAADVDVHTGTPKLKMCHQACHHGDMWQWIYKDANIKQWSWSLGEINASRAVPLILPSPSRELAAQVRDSRLEDFFLLPSTYPTPKKHRVPRPAKIMSKKTPTATQTPQTTPQPPARGQPPPSGCPLTAIPSLGSTATLSLPATQAAPLHTPKPHLPSFPQNSCQRGTPPPPYTQAAS